MQEMVSNLGEFLKNSANTILFKIKKKIRSKRGKVVKTCCHASYGGNYVLTVQSVKYLGDRAEYCRGIVKKKDGTLIATIERKASKFPFAFIEHHADGNDYLVCAAEVHGQTVVQLNTGRQINYIALPGERNHGFRWASIVPSPDGRTLAVEGSFWAAPYETVFFDFSRPMMAPHPEISRFEEVDCFVRWTSPMEASMQKTSKVTVKHGKAQEELTPEEALEVGQMPVADAWTYRTSEFVWKRT